MNGRGTVLSYADGNAVGQYFYREIIEGTKRYRTKLIEGANTLLEAVEKAADVAIEMREEDPHHKSGDYLKESVEVDKEDLLRREEKVLQKKEKLLKDQQKNGKRSILIKSAISDFLASQKKRVDAGAMEYNSYTHKYYCFKKIAAYLEDKGVVKTHQIKETTFDDYLIFRSDTTRILQNREIAVISEWFKSYLVRNKYVSTDIYLKGNFLPRVEVRMVDRMANPAISPEDWKKLVDYVRDVWRREAVEGRKPYYQHGELKGSQPYPKKTIFYRTLFWHYILFSKNTGMSPEEVLKLKWKNVEIRDVGRLSKTKYMEEVEEYESEGIEVIGEFPGDKIDENAWAPNENYLGREERLVAYVTTIRSKTKQPREIPCNQGRELRRWMNFIKEHFEEYEIEHSINPNDYVFMNPYNDFKPVHQNRIRKTFRTIVDKLVDEGQLKGHKFSEHRYTLYSMRSTFIEDHLMKGTDIFLLARIAGHDVKTLMQSYERMDIQKRAEEITKIDYGKKEKEVKVVDLFE